MKNPIYIKESDLKKWHVENFGSIPGDLLEGELFSHCFELYNTAVNHKPVQDDS